MVDFVTHHSGEHKKN